MLTLVLAGVIGSVLVMSQTTPVAAQSTSTVDPAGDASGQAPGSSGTTVQAGQLPYSRLFTLPENATVLSEAVVRLAAGTRQDTTSAADDIVCGTRVLRGNPNVDSGIFMPRRDTHVDFKIRRVTPPCLDRSVIIPKRER